MFPLCGGSTSVYLRSSAFICGFVGIFGQVAGRAAAAV
jgi:hypothetical protein